MTAQYLIDELIKVEDKQAEIYKQRNNRKCGMELRRGNPARRKSEKVQLGGLQGRCRLAHQLGVAFNR